MDRPDCDVSKLEKTYEQFSMINSLLSKWVAIYKKYLRPEMIHGRSYTLLDIGFGGGDIPLLLSKLHITAIEADERAFSYSQKLPGNDLIEFRNCLSTDLVREGLTYDFVISNHLIHHLSEYELLTLLEESDKLADKKVLFNVSCIMLNKINIMI